ncbi:hypothetical protein [Actinomadura sp. 9N215]|uniref:hypothetical protein n=1 Tax=Actinomadura sp. 9N215 TaxID=3375150 RepID=UPI00378DFF12
MTVSGFWEEQTFRSGPYTMKTKRTTVSDFREDRLSSASNLAGFVRLLLKPRLNADHRSSLAHH